MQKADVKSVAISLGKGLIVAMCWATAVGALVVGGILLLGVIAEYGGEGRTLVPIESQRAIEQQQYDAGAIDQQIEDAALEAKKVPPL
jgi:hypothetical protein